MPFSEPQIKLLSGKLNGKHVRTREHHGKELSYIEGWHAIAEANRIFGFDAWDRETVWAECVWQDLKREPKACAYAVRIRIRVRAGETVVCREGSGVGQGTGASPGDAHESALKEAETDATKRALATFGNPFGLALYDKEQNGVSRRGRRALLRQPVVWIVFGSADEVLATCTDAHGFCSAMRVVLSGAKTAQDASALWARNEATIASLKVYAPTLATPAGVHYADLLEQVYRRHCEQIAATAPTATGNTSAEQTLVQQTIDKSALALSAPKRLRDQEHLEFVASLPCLVCGRTPSQAHHLRFAQARSMGSKPSDEWTVPLCLLHHRALHDNGAEEAWWEQTGINALTEAEKLWAQSHGRSQVVTTALPDGEAPAGNAA